MIPVLPCFILKDKKCVFPYRRFCLLTQGGGGNKGKKEGLKNNAKLLREAFSNFKL